MLKKETLIGTALYKNGSWEIKSKSKYHFQKYKDKLVHLLSKYLKSNEDLFNCSFEGDNLRVMKLDYHEATVFILMNANEIDLFYQMKEIIEFSSDGIYVVDGHGYTLLVNKAYEEISGIKRGHLIGKHMGELIEGGKLDRSVSLSVLKEKKEMTLVQTINKKNEVIVTGSPVFNHNGEINMVVTSVRDVTRLNRMQDKIKRAEEISMLTNNTYRYKQQSSEEVIFKSDKMKEINLLVMKVAPYPTSILLRGETGVGKEVLANQIHNFSNRYDKPFIKINCGALPENLIESELFGYEAGSFTGAKKDGKMGLIELAHKGTILLDEIGDMPLSLQVKLLRVLQDKRIQRVGGTKYREVDIRLIAATNRDLKRAVSEGEFREDLYYRIAVLEIDIPPLRERKEDIKEILNSFLNHFNKRYNLNKSISNSAMQLLVNYEWPGNVRELKNTIENLVVSVHDTVIDNRHLNISTSIKEKVVTDSSSPLKVQLNQLEKQLIEDSLGRTSSIRQAAKQLGIHHATLLNKIKKHRIEVTL
ncbi:sigma-54 interaction domain-containing protein [Evansella halocellulosilytica]|uniref:sigma-54 interaction domain-containing protein n=1 Tax=Evansella halocellulosilytica TaxID=2011013 RepID=UPI00211CE25E|nr:sigma 54-interacting transcriptional regulator [Evansella halocellulosilytica]